MPPRKDKPSPLNSPNKGESEQNRIAVIIAEGNISMIKWVISSIVILNALFVIGTVVAICLQAPLAEKLLPYLPTIVVATVTSLLSYLAGHLTSQKSQN